MKKIILMTVFAAVICSASFAQVRFGAQIGGALSFAQTETGANDDLSNKPRIGILAGVLADIPLGPVSFRPELNFIQKGYKNTNTFTTGGLSEVTEDKVRLNYAELPLNFVYNIPAGSGKVYVGLGPNFALGLSGKIEEEATTTDGGVVTVVKEKGDVKFSGNSNSNATTLGTLYLKRFDFGGNVLAGYQTAMGLSVGIQFTLGLSDISRNINIPGIDDNFTQKNHTLSLKVGYAFGGSKTKSTTTSSSSTGSGTF